MEYFFGNVNNTASSEFLPVQRSGPRKQIAGTNGVGKVIPGDCWIRNREGGGKKGYIRDDKRIEIVASSYSGCKKTNYFRSKNMN